MLATLCLISGLALMPQAEASIRFHAPESWSQLQIPEWTGKQAPSRTLKRAQAPIPTTVVVIQDRASEQEFRDFNLLLAAQVQSLLEIPPPSLHEMQLGSFMSENAHGGSNYAKALVDVTLSFWNPGPLRAPKDDPYRVPLLSGGSSSWYTYAH
jgi:hypothetical protein